MGVMIAGVDDDDVIVTMLSSTREDDRRRRLVDVAMVGSWSGIGLFISSTRCTNV